METRINIWIVEDDDGDCAKAVAVIESLGWVEQVAVFRERNIQWGDDLEQIVPAAGSRPLPCIEHMPTIVVLDLLDRDDQPAALQFYSGLRRKEAEGNLPASFVIAWSVKTGLPEVVKFLSEKPQLDRRLICTQSKTPGALHVMLNRCLKDWREAQHL